MKYLGAIANERLLKLTNDNCIIDQIPTSWQHAIEIPFCNTQKVWKCYRAISLTSQLQKITECMIQTDLIWWLQKKLIHRWIQIGLSKWPFYCRSTYHMHTAYYWWVSVKTPTSTIGFFIEIAALFARVWRRKLLPIVWFWN